MPKKTTKKSILTRKQKIAAAEILEYNHAGRSAMNDESAEEYLENPVKSDSDPNRYRVIKLSNGLTVTLISWPGGESDKEDSAASHGGGDTKWKPPQNDKTKDTTGSHWSSRVMKVEETPLRAYCCLSINVGWFCDPPGSPQSLSTMLRNVMLISSQKYPQEDSFITFLRKNNGTVFISPESFEFTYFSFTIPLSHFSEGIDRFSNCFANPLLRRATVTKYTNPMSKQSLYDYLTDKPLDRKSRLLYSLLCNNPRHPGKAIGKQTAQKFFRKLGNGLYDEVEAFMKRHYSAHRMKLVIQTHLPLDTLEAYARKYFSRLPNNGLPPVDLSSFTYDRCFNITAFNMIYEIIPELNNKKETVEFIWAMPPISDHYRTKPQQYIEWMFQNPRSGSLGYYLKTQWSITTEVKVGETDVANNTHYYLFNLSLQLTPEGKKNLKKVLDAVYSYVNFLKCMGTEKRMYDEVRSIAEARFRVDADDLVENACKILRKTMHLYPSVDYLTANSIYYEYDPESIKTCLDCLSPEKTLIILQGHNMIRQCSADDSDLDSEDEGVNGLKTIRIPKKWINDWRKIEPFSSFKFSDPNIFCPDDFSLVPIPKNLSRLPVKIYSDSAYEVWHKLDHTRHKPDCVAYLIYTNDLPLQSVENAVMLDLFAKILSLLLDRELYPATLVGMTYVVKTFGGEFTVEGIGIRQKLTLLMQTIGKYIGTCSILITEELLCTVKNQMLAFYHADCNSSEALTLDIQTSLLKNIHWTVSEKLAVYPQITLEKFKYFVQCYTAHGYVRSYVYGNIETSKALEIVRHFIGASKCKPPTASTKLTQGIKEIPRGYHYCKVQRLTSKPSYNYTMNYYQIGKYSSTTAAGLELLSSLATNTVLLPLRAHQDLEFSDIKFVEQTYLNNCSLLGYSIVLKNFDAVPNFATDKARIEAYRKFMIKVLEKLPATEWEAIQSTFVKSKRDANVFDNDQHLVDWQEVKQAQYVFDRDNKQADAIASLATRDFKTLIIGLIADDHNTRMLSIQTIGHTEPKCKKDEARASPKDFEWKISTDSTPNSGNESEHFITNILAYKSTLKTFEQ